MGLNDSILRFLDGRVGTAGRYLVVSAVNLVNHQILLWVANSVLGWPGGVANAFAATVNLLPAYWLTRSWVWSVSRAHSVSREILPFFALAGLGIVISSITSEIAQRVFGTGLMVNLGSLAGYVAVWILKFFVLERIFAEDSAADSAEEPAEDDGASAVGVS